MDVEQLAVSAAEAAKLLGISKPTVYELMRRSDFPSFKLGRRTLVSVEGLKKWISEQAEEKL